MSISTKQKQTHRYREWICCCQGGGDGEARIGSLGLANAISYIEWIKNKVLQYSTGNYIQYPVVNHNGKELEKSENIFVLLSHFTVQQKLTQHCKSTILQ